MIQINKQLIDDLFAKAKASDRKRMNYDLRTSAEDGGQRMLNALMPGTVVPIHRHPMSNENVICLCGKLVEVLYPEVSPMKRGARPLDAFIASAEKEYRLPPEGAIYYQCNGSRGQTP